MTPDPLPAALPELQTVAWRWPSGRLAHFRIDPISEPKLAPLCVALVRKSDAEAALRAQAEEVERLRADAERWRALQGIADSVRGWVAFKFDDTEETTYSAEQLAAAIDAHLAARKQQEKP